MNFPSREDQDPPTLRYTPPPMRPVRPPSWRERLRARWERIRAQLSNGLDPRYQRWAKYAAWGFGGCIVLGIVGFFSVVGYYARDLPTIESLKNYRPPQTSRVVDRRGTMIAEWFTERRTVVPMEKVPRVLVLSILAAEDADFYQHEGMDYAGILRALYRDVVKGERQGASTITQQLVKTMLLTPERTIARKVRELILARELEQELSKDEILWLYISHINFGHGRYGVEEASRFYFGKHVEELNLSEASLIAGVPQSPARLSPFTHPEAARKRQLFVLGQLENKRAQYWDDLPLADIQYAKQNPARLRTEPEPGGIAPEVGTIARETLIAQVGPEAAKRGGYRLETGFDLELQAMARQALRNGLMKIDERQKLQAPIKAPKKKSQKQPKVSELAVGRNYEAVVRGANAAKEELILDVGGHAARASIKGLDRWNPKQLTADKFAEVGAQVKVSIDRLGTSDSPAQARLILGPQGALVMIDPRTRDILALVGSDEAIYGFNRATQAVRQPGSTWKPVEYALALETRKFTPASVVLDAPEVYDEWKPNNYETWRYTGAVRLREALAQSINLVAVRVTAEVTPQAVVDFARKLGITTELEPSLALALGASGVRPLELVNAYATFAAGGMYEPARLVKRIRGPSGKDVPLARPPAERVMSAPGAYLITSLMTSVVQGGTGKAAMALERPIAGKTGTSNKVRDAWFIGFTPEIVAGVWVGYDDLRPLGRGESGAISALPIWMEAMKNALQDTPAVDFPMPAGIEIAKIDPKSGKLAYDGQEDAMDEVFIEGTVPTEIANPPDVLDTGSFMMEQVGGG